MKMKEVNKGKEGSHRSKTSDDNTTKSKADEHAKEKNTNEKNTNEKGASSGEDGTQGSKGSDYAFCKIP